MADDMKLASPELVGKRDRIRRYFADAVLAGKVARVTVTADIDKGECVATGIDAVENRREHPVIPEPSVNDHDFYRTTAYRLVPNHFVSSRPLFQNVFDKAKMQHEAQAMEEICSAVS
jgi:hypothetical protein